MTDCVMLGLTMPRAELTGAFPASANRVDSDQMSHTVLRPLRVCL